MNIMKLFYRLKMMKLFMLYFYLQVICIALGVVGCGINYIFHIVHIKINLIPIIWGTNIGLFSLYFLLFVLEALCGSLILEHKTNKAISILNLENLNISSFMKWRVILNSFSLKYNKYPNNKGITLHIFVGANKYTNDIIDDIRRNGYRNIISMCSKCFKGHPAENFRYSKNEEYFLVDFKLTSRE